MKKRKKPESVLTAFYPEEKNEFTESLERARPADLSKTPVSTKNEILKTAARGGLRYAIMIACFLIFTGACVYLVLYTVQYFQKQEENKFLKNFFGKTDYVLASVAQQDTQNIYTLSVDKSMAGQKVGKTTVEKHEYNEAFENIRSTLFGLQRRYPDTWGWIEVPGTTIDYYIVKSYDNDYYLYRSIDGSYNRYGSIFADYRTKKHLEDNRNLVIYGHNMNTYQTMFYPLLEYATDEDAFNNRPIKISTQDGIYTYYVFSVYDTDTNFNYIKTYFTSDEDYVKFLTTIEEKSIFHKDVELNADSKIVTLSTCTVRQDDRRWAIHGVLVGISR